MKKSDCYISPGKQLHYSDCRIALGIMDFKSGGTKSKNRESQAIKQHIMN